MNRYQSTGGADARDWLLFVAMLAASAAVMIGLVWLIVWLIYRALNA
jgi:hypothetical protein